MKAIISLAWLICGIIWGTKWFLKSEKSTLRTGRAMDRAQSTFYDWCFYVFLALCAWVLPFGILIQIIKGLGIVFKFIIILGVASIIIYSIYCIVTHKQNILLSFLRKTNNSDGMEEEDLTKSNNTTEKGENEL